MTVIKLCACTTIAAFVQCQSTGNFTVAAGMCGIPVEATAERSLFLAKSARLVVQWRRGQILLGIDGMGIARPERICARTLRPEANPLREAKDGRKVHEDEMIRFHSI